MSYADQYDPQAGVAIVGLAGRFPGARDVDALMRLLREGRSGLQRFAPDELEPSFPEDMAARERDGYVPVRGILDDVDRFDESFFGFSPAEAALLDPQQRLFLQACWEALEDAACDPARFDGLVGVYAGGTANSYYLNNLQSRRDVTDRLGLLTTQMANQGHYIATRVAYKLDLRGPALNLHTACSTSLVAVCTAVQSLLAYQCDMALAGGVSVTLPQRRGYAYQEGSILSPDGHCRPFDAQAAGTVFGNGLGVVVLRRLSDALAAGDRIYAVIKGAALNNDGHGKLSFTAPSVAGQAECIAMAQAMAGIDPQTLQYVEAHGTGTALGDPIEIQALTHAFRAGGAEANGTCAIGSLKASIGHLDAAAGVAGLIRTALALHHRELPGQPNFQTPHPQLELAHTPFVVATEPRPWPRAGTPRRAAVSSLGVGGTNAHVVLEEAPAPLQAVPPRRADEPQLLLVSARDDAALGRARERLATALESLPAEQLADAAQTLHRGRQAFARRSAVVAGTPAAGAAALRAPAGALRSQAAARDGLPVAFLFAGQGAQRVDTWRGLYALQPVFRDELDACVDALRPHLGRDLRELLFPAPAEAAEAQRLLDQTRWTQPALVSLQLALSRLFQHWGIQPSALLGHSVGEWTAACLAGCFTREDTLALVARRGALMQQQSPGAMLAVRASVAELQAELGDSVALAACNAPRLNVLAGPAAAVDAVAARLEKRGIGHRRLVTSHAFHSPMMDPLLAEFEACVARTPRRAPTVPWVSSLTGSPITSEQAQSPAYWARQLRETVQFSEGVGHLLTGGYALLDIGPGDGLARLARQHPQALKGPLIAAAAAPATGEGAAGAEAAALHEDLASVLRAAGALWCAGAVLDAEALRPGPWRRVRLPHYPFAHHRHWVDPAPPASPTAGMAPSAAVLATMPDAAPGPAATEPTPTTGAAAASPAPANTTPSTPSLAPMSLSPASHLMPALRALVADLSGVDAASLDADTPFLALGLDSLALTQLTQAVQKQFGVRLPLRRLLEDLDTLDALAAELAPQVPAAAVAPASPAPSMPVALPSVPGAAPATAVAEPAPGVMPAVLPPPGSTLVGGPGLAGWADVIAQQLQVMQRQLEVMRQGASPVAASAAPLAAPVAMAEAPSPVPAANAATAAVPSPRAAAAPPAPGSPAHGPYRPPSTQRQGSLLSATQAEQLQAFTARYTARTAQSKRMTQDSRGVLADPRSVAGYRQWCKELVYPLVTQRSAGSRLWDVDGNEYIDITNGFGMILFGHNPDTVREAVQAQLERGYEIGPQTPLAASVARDLCAMVGLERAAFCSTGSEAVMAAMRLARTVTGRDTVVVFAGAYHGVFDEVLVRGGADGAALPIAPGIPASAMQHVRVLEYGTPESLQAIRRLGPELAAVLVEPVQSRRPELQPREFLQELRRITADCGAALVFDEVVTGFRVHPGGAQALFGVKADMATYGKVLGGGLPIGVLAGAARFLDALDGGPWQFGDDSAPEVGVTFFAGTFVRHPLALAAAQAVLGRLQREGPQLQRELNQRTTRLVQELRDTAQTLGVPLQVPHFASWFCLRWPAELPLASLFFAALRLHGLHVWEGRPCFLTTAHSDEDLQRIVQAVRRALIELQQAGLLPAPDGAETPTTTVDTPPVPGARKGRDREGREAWFVPDPDRPGKFLQVLGTGVPPRNEAR